MFVQVWLLPSAVFIAIFRFGAVLEANEWQPQTVFTFCTGSLLQEVGIFFSPLYIDLSHLSPLDCLHL